MKEFTKEELAQFDGQEGRKAYVAIDGEVYDVTPIKPWEGGKHFAGAHAGADMSEKILESPHGKSVLAKLEHVGKYVG
jgi:predicted heme/steroid binding protein